MFKRIVFPAFGRCMFLLAVLFLPAMSIAGPPVPPLPPLLIPAPPPVVLIPGTYAYFAPDVDADLIFIGGFWYRPYEGGWYRSSYYSGPWRFISSRNVPRVLIDLRPGFRNVPPGHQRIPHGQLKKKWKTWERERHWDKPGRGKKHDRKESEERSSEQGSERGHVRGHGR
jgi:hypothetical protein